MLQRYKLRLGDGTVLLVDRDSLGTWLVDRGATVQSDTSGRWRPLKEVVARQRVIARRELRRRPSAHESAPSPRASAPRDESGPLTPSPRADGLPLIPPPPRRGATPQGKVPTLRADGLPLVFPSPRAPLPEAPAPLPAPAARSGAASAVTPVVSEVPPPEAAPPRPDPAPATPAPPESAPATPGGPEAFSFDPATLVEPETGAEGAGERAESDLPPTVVVGTPQTVLVEDDVVIEVIDTLPDTETGGPAREYTAEDGLVVQTIGDTMLPSDSPPGEAAAVRELPIIRFKPAKEESPPEPPAPERNRAGESRPRVRTVTDAATTPRSSRAPGSQREEDPSGWARGSRVSAALRLTGALGGVLSRGLEPLNRLERGLPPIVVEEGALTRAGSGMRRLLHGARARMESARDRIRPTPAPPVRPIPASAVAPMPVPLPRLDAEPPPPPPERLAVLPLADALDTPRVEEVYEDGEAGGLLPRAWQWTKAVVLFGALAAAFAFAAMSWETWFPTAGQVGQIAFTEIDRHAHAAERAEQQSRILAEARERLPFLSPETVQLILSRSPGGLLEVPDVFEAACDAADWGSWVLTPAEADELRRLRGLAIGTLGPGDRARVDEYDRARASGLVFPLDNRLGALLWARGTRGLPPPGQERLRELLGKAVTAGIFPPGAVASRTNGP